MKYSFVIPVHNEEGNLPALMEEIEGARKALNGPAEVIFVDDGSTDSSGKVLQEIHDRSRDVVVIALCANAGQSAALSAGIDRAKGSFIITMDADLQNNAGDLARMQDYCANYGVVIGRRAKRQDSFIKRVTSRFANRIRNYLTGDSISDTGCSLRIIDADILRKIPRFNGMHRFLPTLCRLEGASVFEVDVSHRWRKHGTSHYGTWDRAFRTLADAFAVRWMISRKLRYGVAKEKS